MPWARLDDNFPDHPKVIDLSDTAFRLLVAMICHCARSNTDGHVKRADLPRLIRGYKPKHLKELIDGGNVHEAGHECPDPLCQQPAKEDVYVHGYLERNRSKEKIEADRAAAAKRKADFLAKKAAKEAKERERNADQNGVPNANGNTAPTQPSPTQPVGHGFGLGDSQANQSPPSPSAGDDEEGQAPPLEVVKAIVSEARKPLRAVPYVPGPEGAKDCPCGVPWADCVPSCPELNRPANERGESVGA